MKPKFEIPRCETCDARYQSIFKDLDNMDLEKLSLHKGCNFHRQGQVLFQEGGYPAGVYCISQGRVKLYKIGADGKEKIMRMAKAGDVVGYRSLISGTPYNLSAQVLEDAAICFIPKSTFQNMLTEISSFNVRVLDLLCHDLATAELQELSLAQRSVKERLVEVLLMLKEFYGFEDDGTTLKGALSREDIANIVGTSTETVIRLLSELNTRGIVKLVRKKIKIIDTKALLRITDVYD
ncbi:MAG TPA: Crp/Fnr family transcriptional regulator [Bacteroidota bacterium]|nr:Crp/Fnr family transcriptional regulator [Bacteroidota bacterium]